MIHKCVKLTDPGIFHQNVSIPPVLNFAYVHIYSDPCYIHLSVQCTGKLATPTENVQYLELDACGDSAWWALT